MKTLSLRHYCVMCPLGLITSLTIFYSSVLFRRRSKKTSKLRVTGFCVGNSPGTGELPAQRASNAENVSIWWRHHVYGTPALWLIDFIINQWWRNSFDITILSNKQLWSNMWIPMSRSFSAKAYAAAYWRIKKMWWRNSCVSLSETVAINVIFLYSIQIHRPGLKYLFAISSEITFCAGALMNYCPPTYSCSGFRKMTTRVYVSFGLNALAPGWYEKNSCK